LDEDIEFGDDISEDEEADNAVDNVKLKLFILILFNNFILIIHF